MGETVSQNDRSPMLGPSTEFLRTLSWIHASLPPAELDLIVEQVADDIRSSHKPLMLCSEDGGKIQSAAYFRILPGQTATLGGIRCLPGREPISTAILERLSERLQATGIRQIQAVIDAEDLLSQALVRIGNFETLTSVRQMCRNVGVQIHADSRQASTCRPERSIRELATQVPATQVPATQAPWTWRPANSVSREQLIELIDQTFTQTLDCPLLNDLRTTEQALDGFLQGQELSEIDNWFVLESRQQLVGCVLMTKHSSEVAELAYMGLRPEHRGNRLGGVLINKAIKTARLANCQWLVAGVDTNNAPAVYAYQRHSFHTHRTFSVLLHAAAMPSHQRRRAG